MLDGDIGHNTGSDSNSVVGNHMGRALETIEQQASFVEVAGHNDISGTKDVVLAHGG